jgi:hypothetical protein
MVRIALSAIFSFGLLLGLLSCANVGSRASSNAGEPVFYVPKVREEMVGTWVNPASESPGHPRKVVIHAWGLLEWFKDVEDTVPDQRATSTIVSAWSDEEGNTWYRDYQRWGIAGGYAQAGYALLRVSGNGKTLEMISAGTGWPSADDMSPEQNTTYLRYERQE